VSQKCAGWAACWQRPLLFRELRSRGVEFLPEFLFLLTNPNVSQWGRGAMKISLVDRQRNSKSGNHPGNLFRRLGSSS
jgi:hypothetical protein